MIVRQVLLLLLGLWVKLLYINHHQFTFSPHDYLYYSLILLFVLSYLVLSFSQILQMVGFNPLYIRSEMDAARSVPPL